MSQQSQTRPGLEFLAVMTFLGVITAVLVLIIDQQIKRDIVRQAEHVRGDIAEFMAAVEARRGVETDGPATDGADGAD